MSMKVILLGGQSIANKGWIESIHKSLEDGGLDSEIMYYDHWSDGRESADVDVEVQKLSRLVSDKGEYMIFAKSIGTILTLKANFEGRISPLSCIFCGVPYDFAKKLGHNIDDWIGKLNIKVTVFQKSGDPYGGYNRIDEVMKGGSIEVVRYRIEGESDNDHNYANIDYITNMIKKDLNEHS